MKHSLRGYAASFACAVALVALAACAGMSTPNVATSIGTLAAENANVLQGANLMLQAGKITSAQHKVVMAKTDQVNSYLQLAAAATTTATAAQAAVANAQTLLKATEAGDAAVPPIVLPATSGAKP